MKNQRDFDVNLMYEQGCVFMDCAESMEIERSENSKILKAHFNADISLSALACEIYIKCLIILNGGTYKREHTLDDLWRKYKTINNDKAYEVENSLLTWLQSNDPNMFNKMIKEASDAFTQWRYAYEYDSGDNIRVNKHFLRGFRTDLRTLCYKTIYSEDDK